MYIPNDDKQNYPSVDESIGRVPKDCNKISKNFGYQSYLQYNFPSLLDYLFLENTFFLEKGLFTL